MQKTCHRSISEALLTLKVFFITIRTRGWGHFDPPANSETKEARTMKLCTLIAYYITSITKQLKFLNSHCSIVCSYCSFVCLITKSEPKSDQIFKFIKLNEIHKVDSPFNEDPKNIIIFQGGPNFGGGTARNFNPPC